MEFLLLLFGDGESMGVGRHKQTRKQTHTQVTKNNFKPSTMKEMEERRGGEKDSFRPCAEEGPGWPRWKELTLQRCRGRAFQAEMT